MTEVLLKELSNRDIDWMTQVGHQEEIAAGTVLIEPGKLPEVLHLIINGTLSFSVAERANHLFSHASTSVLSSKMAEWELTKLGSGDVVGEMSLIGSYQPVVTVKTLEKSLVLSIPLSCLEAKLQQDLGFAAHFYRAIAILLSHRQRVLANKLSSTHASTQEEPRKQLLTFFGKLNDSDIHWMMSVSSKQKIPAGTAFICQGRPVDGLYILMGGTVAVSICHANISSLSRAFACQDNAPSSTKQEVARYSTGEIVGAMTFLEDDRAHATIKSLENCLVLVLPRNQLLAKLQMDLGFAARFHQAISAVVQERLRNTIVRLTSGQLTERTIEMLDQDVEHQDEIDFDVLNNYALAGARFDWMLRRFRGD